MRNGNIYGINTPSNVLPVLTVPMRNGNYEVCIKLLYADWVLTVPMRNGNSFQYQAIFPDLTVLTVPMRNGNTPLKTLTSVRYS